MGEDPDEALAHFAAVRAELGATGPVARHLAETAAASILRSSRADRLEGELLAGLAEGGRPVAKAFHADRDARATLALFQRYRREAEGELRRALDTICRLHRARTDGLFPYGEEAEEAQGELDETLSELVASNEPKIEETAPSQPLKGAANDDAPSRRPCGVTLLRQYRWFKAEADRAGMWRGFTPAQRAAVLAAAGAGHLDPATPYDALRPVLAGGAAIDRAAPAST